MLTRHERWKKGAGKYNAIKYSERLKNYNSSPTLCKNCNNPLDYSLRKNKFCNHSCSAKFTNVNRAKENNYTTKGKVKSVLCTVCNKQILVSVHVSKNTITCQDCKNYTKKITRNTNTNKSQKYKLLEYTCKCCQSKFYTKKRYRLTCSNKCTAIERIKGARKGGQKSAMVQSITRRSKNEKYFAYLCEQKFNNVLTNQPIFNGWDADVILPDQKIAILWNGAWHYKKITKKHSVRQVQNRDSIKCNEIYKAGFEPYIIKDMGIENRDFVDQEFKKFCLFLENKLQEMVPPHPRHSL
jgi:hypothetical protein